MRSQLKATLVLLGIVVAGFALGSCGGASGSCVGTGGVVDECKEDWTKNECDEWDDQGVNGSSWDFGLGSCESRGYDIECSDGSWVKSSGDC